MLEQKQFRERRSRGGRHCDLCGCSSPAVRCDKCNMQLFCLSCDDMYHRHPKRKSHLRRAVDSLVDGGGRLPSHSTQILSGDPSKMPIPPPRKKKEKTIFGTIGRSSTAETPLLPRKEFSWSNKLGSLKRFMASRPLPPTPKDSIDGGGETLQASGVMSDQPQMTRHHGNEGHPPSLPQRTLPRTHQRVNSIDELIIPRTMTEIKTESQFQTENREDQFTPQDSRPDSTVYKQQMAKDIWSENQQVSVSFQPTNREHNQQAHSDISSEDRRSKLALPGFQLNIRRHSQPVSPNFVHQHATERTSAENTQGQEETNFLWSQDFPANIPQANFSPGAGTLGQPYQSSGPVIQRSDIQQQPSMMLHSMSVADLSSYPQQHLHFPPYTHGHPYFHGHTFFHPNCPQCYGSSWGTSGGQHIDNIPFGRPHPGKDGTLSRMSQQHAPDYFMNGRMKRSQSVMYDPMAVPGSYFPFGPHHQGYGMGPPYYPRSQHMSISPSPSGSTRSLHRVGKPHKRQSNDEQSVASGSSRGKARSSIRERTMHRRSKGTDIGTTTEEEDYFSVHENSEDDEILSEAASSIRRYQKKRNRAKKFWECEHCTYRNPLGTRICQMCCKTSPRGRVTSHGSKEEEEFKSSILPPELESPAEEKIEEDRNQQEEVLSKQTYPQTETSTGITSKEQTEMPLVTAELIKQQEEIEKEIRERLHGKLNIQEDEKMKDFTEPAKQKHLSVSREASQRTSVERASEISTKDTDHSFSSGNKEATINQVTETSHFTVDSATNDSVFSLTQNFNKTPSLSKSGHRRDSSVQTHIDAIHEALKSKPEESVLEYSTEKNKTEDVSTGTSSLADAVVNGHKVEMGTSPPPQNIYTQTTFDSNTGGFLDLNRPFLNNDVVPPNQSLSSYKQASEDRRLRGALFRSLSRSSLNSESMAMYPGESHFGPVEPFSFKSGGTPLRGEFRNSSWDLRSRPHFGTSRFKNDQYDWRQDHNLSKQDKYRSMEELVERRRQENMRVQGMEMVRLVREAEQHGFSADELQVALSNCGKQNPIHWLQENWKNMVETVVTLATNYGHDKRDNNVGIITETESREALVTHRGNVWASVTECVEGRQRKFMELSSRGNFSPGEIVAALTASHGNVEKAYIDLTKSTVKPFLMRIWGPGAGVDNQEGAIRQHSLQPTISKKQNRIWSEEISDLESDQFSSHDILSIPSPPLSIKTRESSWSRDISEVETGNGISLPVTQGPSPSQSVHDQQWGENINDFKSGQQNHTVFPLELPSSVSHSTHNRIKSESENITDVELEQQSPVVTRKNILPVLRRSASELVISITEGKQKDKSEKSRRPSFLRRLASLRKDKTKEKKKEKGTNLVEQDTPQTCEESQFGKTYDNTEQILEGNERMRNHDMYAVSSSAVNPDKINLLFPRKNDSALFEIQSSKNTSSVKNSQFEEPRYTSEALTEIKSSKKKLPSFFERNKKLISGYASKNVESETNKNQTQLNQTVPHSVSGNKIEITNYGKTMKDLPSEMIGIPADTDEDEIINSNDSSSNVKSKTSRKQKYVAKKTHNRKYRATSKTFEIIRKLNQKSKTDSDSSETDEPPVRSDVKRKQKCNIKSTNSNVEERKKTEHALNVSVVNKNIEQGLRIKPDLSVGAENMATGCSFDKSIKSKSQNSFSIVEKNKRFESALGVPEINNNSFCESETTPKFNKIDVISNADLETTIENKEEGNQFAEHRMTSAISKGTKANESKTAFKGDNISSSPNSNLVSNNTKQISHHLDQPQVLHPLKKETLLESSERTKPPKFLDLSRKINAVSSSKTESSDINEDVISNADHKTTIQNKEEESQSPEHRMNSAISKVTKTNISKIVSKGDNISSSPNSNVVPNNTKQIAHHLDQPQILEPLKKETLLESSERTKPPQFLDLSIQVNTVNSSKTESNDLNEDSGNLLTEESYVNPISETKSTEKQPTKKGGSTIRNFFSSSKKKNYRPVSVTNEKRLEFERKVRSFLAQGKCQTYEQSEIVVKLMDMKFDEKESLQAAMECDSLYQAVNFLQQECELCSGKFPMAEMLVMIHCSHRACKECLKAYFTIQIRDRNIMELRCPFCNEPDLSNEDVAQDYFTHMDQLLKNLVESDIHELFQKKLRDKVLMKDPNFHWCSQCSSGFISNPNQKRLMCPDCKAIICAHCRKLWEKQHDGITCEQFQTWKNSNDPETQAAGLAKHLEENGIVCPSCHFQYSLAKGGCMHFRCIQCQYDFCSGCGGAFKMGKKCGLSNFCEKLGLHAHHPRNCLFYLRDKDPADLQELLDAYNIPYNKEPPEGTEIKEYCQVMEQKEMPSGLVDDICGKEVLEGHAGLCRVHYVEYLVEQINNNNLEPLTVMDVNDLQLMLRWGHLPVPQQIKSEPDEDYRERLLENIEKELPIHKIVTTLR
ncbi:linear Ubiquitin E3 ligase isoform X2 [Tachypleus tridentatus]|uniref:linear Ubiquitin E3 ligase isoform X2 n=1 Tax=Tachypleus tridentatus TaxID=6853 RepID=UPI003FD6436D